MVSALLVVFAALVFAFANGLLDAGNGLATVLSTGVLRPRTAVLAAALLNLAGAFLGTAVARTIRHDLLDPAAATELVVLAGLVGALGWSLFTWTFEIPSSSSHALFGGLVGAAWMAGGSGAIRWEGVLREVVIPLVLSPFLAFVAAFVGMVALLWTVRRVRPSVIHTTSRRLQLLSSAFLAVAHGSNDAQKSVGVVMLGLAAGGSLPGGEPPAWAIVACALALGIGTGVGGWSILRSMGSRVFKLRPLHCTVAETSAAMAIQVCSVLGLPTSTTHCISTAIMGVGATTRFSAVSWGVTRRILVAWGLTIPASAALSAMVLGVLSASGA